MYMVFATVTLCIIFTVFSCQLKAFGFEHRFYFISRNKQFDHSVHLSQLQQLNELSLSISYLVFILLELAQDAGNLVLYAVNSICSNEMRKNIQSILRKREKESRSTNSLERVCVYVIRHDFFHP